MSKASKYPPLPESGNRFDWVLLAAAEMRAKRQAVAAVQKAKKEAARPPRDRDAMRPKPRVYLEPSSK